MRKNGTEGILLLHLFGFSDVFLPRLINRQQLVSPYLKIFFLSLHDFFFPCAILLNNFFVLLAYSCLISFAAKNKCRSGEFSPRETK